MNRKCFFLFLLLLTGFTVLAQNQGGNSPAEKLSTLIAQKMKDSLLLTNTQYQQVYAVNMQLFQQKTAARQQYASDMSMAMKHVQLIENTRDSLYKPFLNTDQYILYKQKKKYLISGRPINQ